MDYLCRFKNGELFVGSGEWLYKVSFLSMLLDSQKNRPVREQLKVGDKNVIYDQLLSHEKIIFSPLHIKLELMKQFVKAPDKNGKCFQYISSAFPGLSNERLRTGIFLKYRS